MSRTHEHAFDHSLPDDPAGAWEFDAPQFYDFCAGSPPGADASAWFDVQASKQLGCRSPLAEVQQNANAWNQQNGTGSLGTPKGAPAAGPLNPTQLTNPPASAPPVSGVPTAPKTQARNIVTSWAGKENTSAKKKLEHQPQSHHLPPKSASKRPPQNTQEVEEVPEPMQVDSPQGHHTHDEQEGTQPCAGQQDAMEQSPPAKRAAHTQPCQTASKAQRVSMQQHSRFEPRITRSATKAKRETPSMDEASKFDTPKESLRAAMAKARATRTAKAAAAAAAPAPGPQAPTPSAPAKPFTSTKQDSSTTAHVTRPVKATQPRPKQTGPASRPRATTAAPAGTARTTQAGPGRGQHTSCAGTRTRAAATAQSTRQVAGAAVGRQAQGPGRAQGREAGGSLVGAAVGPAALRTRAAHRQASSGATKADARNAHLSLGVTRGSGVAKVKGNASGTVRKTDPLKLKKMLQTRKVLPIRSTKPLTLPEEPVLGARRSRRNSSQEPEMAQKTPFKPLAVRVQEFHTRTPPRYKAKPVPAAAQRPLSMTQPKEPTLRTSSRLRACYAKSREEEELQAMANMPKFHARPLNHHILEAPRTTSAAKAAAKHAPTPPQPFNFITDDRLQRRHQQQQQQQHQQQQEESFKALPLNRALLDHPVGLPKKPRMSLTVPKSPMLRTRSRTSAQASRQQQEEEVPNTAFKARPVPDFLQVPREFQAVAREPPAPIQQKPFQLRTDQRGQQHQSRLRARLAELEQEQEALRVRKAQQLPPTIEHPAIPPKPEPKPLTVPHPFKLRSEVRHENYVAEFTSHLSEEERQKQAEAEFKARAMWNGVPFRPRESEAPLTAPSEFALATIARASERQAFDQQIEEKWRAIEEEKAAAEEAARKAEEEEVRQYRRTLRFKANPLPKQKYTTRRSVAAAPSKPLTLPKTPQLGRKRKAADSVDK